MSLTSSTDAGYDVGTAGFSHHSVVPMLENLLNHGFKAKNASTMISSSSEYDQNHLYGSVEFHDDARFSELTDSQIWQPGMI
jgi:hypothetical protein